MDSGASSAGWSNAWEVLSASGSRDIAPNRWRTVASFEADHIPITVLSSQQSGLRVMLAQIKGPLVTAILAVPTEARDDTSRGYKQDDGLSHALEHLVLMGSREFPFRGLIDKLASRSLAQGINAWTDVDHTAYTVTTAGAEGFLTLLPVMMDHLLFPSLTEAAFLTEVHHINGRGLDGGVIYEEMRQKLRLGPEICQQRLLELLYPEGSGYRAVCGGKLENLRKLSNQVVRAYHSQYYRPENLALIITGQLEVNDILPWLEGVENKVADRGEVPPFIRPWFHQPSQGASVSSRRESSQRVGKQPCVSHLEFPTEDPTGGVVLLGWLGPAWYDFQTILCLRIVFAYLVGDTSSPVYHALVEQNPPLCKHVTSSVEEGMPGYHYVQCESVDTARAEQVQQVFTETVKGVRETGLDMTRLRSILHREKLRYMSDLEDDPHNTLARMLLYAFIYGDRDGSSEAALLKDKIQNRVSRVDALPCSEESEEARVFWLRMMGEALLDPGRMVVTIGEPSGKLARDMAMAEMRRDGQQVRIRFDASNGRMSRFVSQAASFDSEELHGFQARLQGAIEENSRPIPRQMIEIFRKPDLTKVPRVPVCSVRNIVRPTGQTMFEVFSTETEEVLPVAPQTLPSGRFLLREPATRQALEIAQGLHEKGLGQETDLPFLLQWDHIESAFVEMTVWLETSSVPDHLRPLIELFLDILFELPVRQDDGTLWSHDEVVRYLFADTVSFSNALGTGRSNFYAGLWSQAASITLKVEADKYWLGVRWLRNLLYRSEMCIERIARAAHNLLGDISVYQKDGLSLCSAMMRSICFDACRSNHAATCFLRQQSVLNAVLQRIRSRPDAVLADMEALRDALTQPSNIRVHVACDLEQQPDPVGPFLRDFLPISQARLATESLRSPTCLSALHPVLQSRHLRTPEALSPTGKGILIALQAADSAYLIQTAPLDPVDVTYTSPVYAALLVAMEYLTAQDSEVSQRIRGYGGSDLATGYEMTCSPEQGLMTLTLFRARSLSEAYEALLEAIKGYLSGALAINVDALEAAKRSLMFEYVERACTGPGAAQQSFINYFRNTPQTFCADHMIAIQAVTAHEALAAMRSHVLRLFDVTRTATVAACHQSKVLSLKFDLTRKHGRPQMESYTVERCFASVEEEASETTSTTGSEASSPHDVRAEARRGWLPRQALGRDRSHRFVIVAALAASAAFVAYSNRR